MGGHSHWTQIKRQKGAMDAKRGQLFTKLAREIAVAAREGGGADPAMNPRLRLAIDRARSYNMPMDSIQRAIQRGLGPTGESELMEAVYEGYGPGGIAILVVALTDNRNRAVSDVRMSFSRHGGSLGEAGCVSWLFEQRGLIMINTAEVGSLDAETIALQAIDAGAEDVRVEDGLVEVHTAPEKLEAVRRSLQDALAISITNAEISFVPKSMVSLDEKDSTQALRLLDRLEELDDVQRVYSNAEFADTVLAAYATA